MTRRIVVSKLKSELNLKTVEIEDLKRKLSEMEEYKSLLQTKKKEQLCLKDYMIKILKESNGPLSAKEIVEMAIEAGYISHSKRMEVHVLNIIRDNPLVFRRATKFGKKPMRYILV